MKKKYQEPEPLGGKYQEPEPLGKKSEAGAAKKMTQPLSPAINNRILVIMGKTNKKFL